MGVRLAGLNCRSVLSLLGYYQNPTNLWWLYNLYWLIWRKHSRRWVNGCGVYSIRYLGKIPAYEDEIVYLTYQYSNTILILGWGSAVTQEVKENISQICVNVAQIVQGIIQQFCRIVVPRNVLPERSKLFESSIVAAFGQAANGVYDGRYLIIDDQIWPYIETIKLPVLIFVKFVAIIFSNFNATINKDLKSICAFHKGRSLYYCGSGSKTINQVKDGSHGPDDGLKLYRSVLIVGSAF